MTLFAGPIALYPRGCGQWESRVHRAALSFQILGNLDAGQGKGPGDGDQPGPNDLFNLLPFLYADGLNLLLSVRLGFEPDRSNLYPGRFGRPSFDDLAFLRRLLLDDVVLGTGRGHQKAYSSRCQS
jgi:hypothetical protein